MLTRGAMVVTDVGGNAEAVLNGETGLVVPSQNPTALADAIVLLAADGGLRDRYGAAGRRRVAETFGLPVCIHRHDALYRALLAGHTPAMAGLC